MQEFEVVDVRTKTGGGGDTGKAPWELVILIGKDGEEVTSFDKKLKDVKGARIKFEPEITAKAGKTKVGVKEWAIVRAPVPGGASATPSVPTRDSYTADPSKIRSMERQAAVRIAFEFGINTSPDGIWTLHEALKNAEAIYQWIANGTIPGEPVPATAMPTAPKAEAKMPSESSPTESPESAQAFNDLKHGGDEIPPMTHIGDLLNWAYKMKPSVPASEVCRIAGVKAATEITDFKKVAEKVLVSRKTVKASL